MDNWMRGSTLPPAPEPPERPFHCSFLRSLQRFLHRNPDISYRLHRIHTYPFPALQPDQIVLRFLSYIYQWYLLLPVLSSLFPVTASLFLRPILNLVFNMPKMYHSVWKMSIFCMILLLFCYSPSFPTPFPDSTLFKISASGIMALFASSTVLVCPPTSIRVAFGLRSRLY